MKCTLGVTWAKPWTVFCTQCYMQQHCFVFFARVWQDTKMFIIPFFLHREQLLGDHLESLVLPKSFSSEELDKYQNLCDYFYLVTQICGLQGLHCFVFKNLKSGCRH